MRRIVLFFVIGVLLSGCSAAAAVLAMNKSTDHFIQANNDERVLYEEGARLLAQKISAQLDTSIKLVEDKQYAKFQKPVKIYVTHSIESFSGYCVSKRPRGCVLNERLFISPRAKDTLSGILTHELSHLHMEQQLGMWHWHSEIPSWFKEGLAVYVSDGGGAEKTNYSDAIKSIAQGKSFEPIPSGSLIFPKTASAFGLEPQMFYAQSSIFIEYLHKTDKPKFKKLILTIVRGSNLTEAMNEVYGKSINEIWEQFKRKITHSS